MDSQFLTVAEEYICCGHTVLFTAWIESAKGEGCETAKSDFMTLRLCQLETTLQYCLQNNVHEEKR